MVQAPTVKQMLADYRQNRLAEDLSGMWGSVVLYRLPGFLLARLATAVGLSATTLTIAGFAMTLAMAMAAVALPAPNAMVLIAILATCFQIIDCADGSVARAMGTESLNGQFLDFASDVLGRCVHLASIGHVAGALMHEPSQAYLVLGLVSALCALYGNLLRRFQATLTAHSARRPTASAPPAFWVKVTKGFHSFLSGLDELVPLLALLAWMGGWLSPFLIAVFLYHAGDVLISGVTCFLKLQAADRGKA